ncbi:hypothetical protein [Nocardia caishijiensis]|uniref:Uncharacterized protein n=1 Tax=Nocardia caishijiensis TaxID=184756 RepID=A0ABQ6YKM5_9NOCA|nr:hypothetical protein [Nocardia caishijiensis]KAF0846344.1 hypothetical protein FNL39_105255 [Nocardia caishijiensis]
MAMGGGSRSGHDPVGELIEDRAHDYAIRLDSAAEADSLDDFDRVVAGFLDDPELLVVQPDSRLRFGDVYDRACEPGPDDELWRARKPLIAGLIAADIEFRGPLRLSPTQNALLATQFEKLGAALSRHELPAHAVRAWTAAMELYRHAHNSDAEDRCGFALARARRATLPPGWARGASLAADLLCGYGYRPFRLLAWVVVQIAVFVGLALLLAGTKSPTDVVYLAVLTFLNPLDPNNVAGMEPQAKLLFATEACLGAVSMSVFFALLVRRWFRL